MNWHEKYARVTQWTATHLPGEEPAFVYEAVTRLRKQGKSINPEAVLAYLRARGRAKEDG